MDVYDQSLEKMSECPPRLKDTITRHSTMISSAPPARYHMKTTKTNLDGDEFVRRWTIGVQDTTKRNKTLLFLGEEGSGKTTLVNVMLNFAIGVKWEDNVRFHITDNFTDQAQDPQTVAVTAYEIFGWEGTELPVSLTLIDTPGITNRDGLRPLTERLKTLFEDEKIDRIDAVCHVVKASQNRLTEHQSDVFDAFQSLLAKNLKNNIVTIITHCDGAAPGVLDIIRESNMQGGEESVHFTFNNHLFQKRSASYDAIYQNSWEDAVASMRRLFEKLSHMEHQHTRQTVEVLAQRMKLEDCGVQPTIKSEVRVTYCAECELNCHVGCLAVRPIICKDIPLGTCSACKCNYRKHVSGYKRYADHHQTLKDQIAECFQTLRKNALKPDLEPNLKEQTKHAEAQRDKHAKRRLEDLAKKKQIIGEMLK